MIVSEVLALLDAERGERGMSNWEKLGSSTAGMRSYGIGLTRLRKLAKRIGRNRELAHALWKTDVYEARVIALLVDDPARITRDQAEKQVEELAGGMLAYVFASCDATLAKTSFVVELADQWVRSDDPVRRDCGYGLLYEASKFSGKKAPSEEFFLAHVERIADTIGTESEKVRLSMGAALMGIGKRSAVLNQAALKVARDVGPIEFTSASGECEPFDVVKHLTTDRLLSPDELAWRRSCNAGWHEQAQRQPGSLQGGRPRAAGRRYPPGAQQAEARAERRSGAVRDAPGGSRRDLAGRPVYISERAVRRERAAGERFEWRDAPRAWRRGRVEPPCCSASA